MRDDGQPSVDENPTQTQTTMDTTNTLGRLRPYPAYKDSGVEWLGKIPAHWEANRLKYAAKLNPTPAAVRSLSMSLDVSFVPMEAVGEYGGLDLTSVKPLAEVNSGYTYFGERDVVVAKITPCFENGKGALVEGLVNEIGFGTTELHVLRAQRTADPGFLFYVSMSDAFRKLGEAEMYGAGGQKRVPEFFIENLTHTLPPLPEQHAIAAFLDRETAKIDALVAKKERLIELLQEKRTALITRAVTRGLDPAVQMKDSHVEWIGEIPAHWGTARLWQVCDATSGGTPLREEPSYWDGAIPWVSPKDMKRRLIDSAEECITERGRHDAGLILIQPPAVLIVVRGMILAHSFPVAVATTPLTINQDMKAIHPRQGVEPLFFAWLLEGVSAGILTTVVEQAAHGTRAIRMDQWRFILLPFPPVNEQRNIAALLDLKTAKIDALIANIQSAIDRLTELRTALISAAVTGKIDVRDDVDANPRPAS